MTSYIAPLAAFSFVTLALMITTHALPMWYTIGEDGAQLNAGIWKACETPGHGLRKVCLSYLKAGNDINPALRSSQAFATIAVILAGVGAITSVLVEIQDYRAHHRLSQVPIGAFGMSSIAMGIAACSFVALVSTDGLGDLLDIESKYDASFFIAWASVATAIVSSLLANFHRINKANAVPPQDKAPLYHATPVDV